LDLRARGEVSLRVEVGKGSTANAAGRARARNTFGRPREGRDEVSDSV